MSHNKSHQALATLVLPESTHNPEMADPNGAVDLIRRRAYEISLNRCGGFGDSLSDWLQAERELLQVDDVCVAGPRDTGVSHEPAQTEARSEPNRKSALSGAVTTGAHILVVIDHLLARIYETELKGSIPERIVPVDADGFGRHLRFVQNDGNGQRKPENRQFYESVAQALRGAEQVLLFGSGTGSSSAMEQLLKHLRHSHADVAGRIIGSLKVDAQHLTEGQLLAKAREFYAANPKLPPHTSSGGAKS